MAQHHHRTGLCDLPDSCLLQVFKHLCPLPDKFSIGACCWRFYRLVSDRRLWLVVSPTGRAPESAPGGAGPVYTTLQAAVQASRPGDTIWLSPGFTHSAADVTIPWPLHLLGGGTHPTDTLVSAPLNADCALSFTASGKVAHLAVSSTLAPCVVHRRGSLTLQHCLLAAEPKGLHHLVSPVVTLAAGSTAAANAAGSSGGSTAVAAHLGMIPPTAIGVAATAAASVDVEGPSGASAPYHSTAQHSASQQQQGAAASTVRGPSSLQPSLRVKPTSGSNDSSSNGSGTGSSSGLVGVTGLLLPVTPRVGCVGPGRLQVVECQLMGGSTAVRCGGTGQVRNVRAIYESHSKAPYLWHDVDSSDGPAAAAVLAGRVGGGGRVWTAAAAEREPGVFTRHLAVLAGRAAAGWEVEAGPGQRQQQQPPQEKQEQTVPAAAADGSDASVLLQQRSKAWRQRHIAQPPAGPEVGSMPGCADTVGLARIQAVLGGRSINPASLAAHLTAKQQQQQA